MIRVLLAIAVLPSLLDAIVRAFLAVVARRRRTDSGSTPSSWSVVIPARSEGPLLLETVTAVETAATATAAGVRIVVLLDGEDAEARASLASSRAEVVTKTPAGPSKAAALAWLVRNRMDAIGDVDGVMIVDVGSALAPDFFARFRWPADAAAAQALLRGRGEGAGAGAAASERSAQRGEDAGREWLGWAVRLRGTGMVFRPDVLEALAPRLATQAEDEEATLLLAADGRRVTLAREALVHDEKPPRAADAAAQRARWLAGRFEIVLRQPRALLRLLARRPAEGLAFVLGLTGRPLALTAPLRLVGGAALIVLSLDPLRPWSLGVGALAVASALLDAAQLAFAGAGPGPMLRLGAAWAAAVFLAPRALARWMRARRP